MPTVDPRARERIGTVTARWTSDPVSSHQVRMYLAAVGGDLQPLGAEAEETLVPPMFFYSLCRRIVRESDLLPDGQHADLGVEGVLGDTVAGGHQATFHRPLRIGDTLTATERLVGIEEKTGRRGTLVLVTTRTEYVNQHGELAVIFDATTVFT